jgi:hypothetical protein
MREEGRSRIPAWNVERKQLIVGVLLQEIGLNVSKYTEQLRLETEIDAGPKEGLVGFNN